MNAAVFREEVQRLAGGAIPMNLHSGSKSADGKELSRFIATVIVGGESLTVAAEQYTVVITRVPREVVVWWRARIDSADKQTCDNHPARGTGALEKVFENWTSGMNVVAKERSSGGDEQSRQFGRPHHHHGPRKHKPGRQHNDNQHRR